MSCCLNNFQVEYCISQNQPLKRKYINNQINREPLGDTLLVIDVVQWTEEQALGMLEEI